ncbi:MAG TPA: SpoIIE family protein phosphatase [Acidimicrobiales bacterium]|nr:SpoIIE family protein phosphatase [Acidimicrobiales bacterium]
MRAPRSWPHLAAVVLVVLVGVVAAWAVARRAAEDADQRERLLAQQTGNVTEATVRQVLAALGGASGLAAPDGSVSAASFRSFATGAVRAAPFETLAFAPLVTSGQRPAFERSVGRPVVDRPGGPPAPSRPRYLPLRWVVPAVGETDRLVGFDLAVDDARRTTTELAAARGEPVVSQVVPAEPNGRPSVVVAHAVYRPGAPRRGAEERRAAVVGFVVTGVQGEALLDDVDQQLGDMVSVDVRDAAPGGDRLPLYTSDPAPAGGTTVERTVGGRSWRITVDDRRGVPAGGAWWLLAATGALAAALLVLARRAERYNRLVGRHVATVDRLAGLGRSLGGVTTADAVSHIVRTEVPGVLGARTATLVPDPLLGSGGDGATAPADERARQVTVRRRIPDDRGATVATLVVSWAAGRPLDDLEVAGLATVSEMCGQALARAALLDRARRDAVTSRLLAGLAEAAATAGTTEQVALTLVDRAAEVAGASAVRVGLLEDDGRSLAVVGRTAGAPGHVRQVVALDAPGPMGDAVRQGTTVLVGDLDEAAARYPGIVEGLRAAGTPAVAAVPLVDGDGKPFGALSLSWPTPTRLDAALATTLQTTAELCASSLARARATDRAQAGTSALATLASRLSTARSVEEVGAAVVADAPPVLHADAALVGLVEGERLRLLAPDGAGMVLPAPYRDADMGSDLPTVRAVRERRLVTSRTLDDPAAGDHRVAEELDRLGLGAVACAPLPGGDGEPAGVLTVLWRVAPPFEEDRRTRITAVAHLCARSIERSRLFDAEHRVRRDLQRSVLLPAPTVPGLAIATRYRPAARDVGMGGDWHDEVVLGHGRVCVVVGDVTGHGAGAVAAMAQIRTVVHTLVVGGLSLVDVLVRTSEMMRHQGLGYATMLLATVDVGSGSLRYATAGHPPPVLREPGGTVGALTGGRHSLLGIEVVPRSEGEVPFPVGSTLVAYTDGLIERRDASIVTSIEELVTQVGAADAGDPDGLADTLLAARPTPRPPEDDVAIVVVHRTG